MIKKLFFVLLANFSVCLSSYGEQVIHTVWGDSKIDDSLLEELIESKAMQRLKNIDQSGPQPYLGLLPFFSRYDHSIGVLALLQKAEPSKIEQVTGLLHDTSHTVFSHLGDNLFYKANQEKSYQDSIHMWFLKKWIFKKL